MLVFSLFYRNQTSSLQNDDISLKTINSMLNPDQNGKKDQDTR